VDWSGFKLSLIFSMNVERVFKEYIVSDVGLLGRDLMKKGRF